MDFWENICTMQAKQTAKGIATYGQRLEDNNTLTDVEYITMMQEEMIDFLMYSEGVKQKLIDFHKKLGDDGK